MLMLDENVYICDKFKVMRKVHLISVTEPLVLDLALAIHEKGYDVSVSGNGITEDVIAKLHAAGCTCHGNGWFPERLTKDNNFVVLGATVKQDNPELIRAKELGLLILSIPEFIFQRTKEKTRVVVAGSRGKKTIISMIIRALQRQKLAFDYALTSEIPLLPNRVHMSYEARIALIEGDEHVTSALEKRFQLEFFRPHIAILTNLSWTPDTDHALDRVLLEHVSISAVKLPAHLLHVHINIDLSGLIFREILRLKGTFLLVLFLLCCILCRHLLNLSAQCLDLSVLFVQQALLFLNLFGVDYHLFGRDQRFIKSAFNIIFPIAIVNPLDKFEQTAQRYQCITLLHAAFGMYCKVPKLDDKRDFSPGVIVYRKAERRFVNQRLQVVLIGHLHFFRKASISFSYFSGMGLAIELLFSMTPGVVSLT